MVSAVLHVLAQRPLLTGSGVTLDALVRQASARGYDQHVVVATPAGEPHPTVGDLPPARVHALEFGEAPLAFAIPGMSDVMPYASTVFSTMTPAQLLQYEARWRAHVGQVVEQVRPALVHTHHVWLVSALLKDVAPDLPVVTHCHATGLRQMELCPALRERVTHGCARNEHFVTLDLAQRERLAESLGVAHDRVSVVGAGYREELFLARGPSRPRGATLLYAGKLSHAKGVAELLDAFERLRRTRPDATLDLVGGGAGAEGEDLARRAAATPGVRLHGAVPQPRLAEQMRRAAVLVLPSYYEGLPLVLVEARACGCRLVATALPSVAQCLAPTLGGALRLVELPAMSAVDRPEPSARPAFVGRLSDALAAALDDPEPEIPVDGLDGFRWQTVFARVERVWQRLCGGALGGQRRRPEPEAP